MRGDNLSGYFNVIPGEVKMYTEKINMWKLEGFASFMFPKSQKQCRHIAGLKWPRGVQKYKFPRFRDNGAGWW